MLQLPSPLWAEFEACLRHASIPRPAHAAYTKWLRYYLDFCQKYHVPHAQQESLPRFLHKLQEKQQTQAQQQQASHAISLYYDLLHLRRSRSDAPSLHSDVPPLQARAVVSPRPDLLPRKPITFRKPALPRRPAINRLLRPPLPLTTRTLPREFPGSPSTPACPMTSNSGTTLRKP